MSESAAIWTGTLTECLPYDVSLDISHIVDARCKSDSWVGSVVHFIEEELSWVSSRFVFGDHWDPWAPCGHAE